MKKLIFSLAALIVIALPAAVRADTLTFKPPATAANNNSSTNNPNNASTYQGGANQFDLDHHRAYTWQINNVVIPAGDTITGATLTFTSIANWDSNPNTLFVHLLNTANNFSTASGTRSATVSGVTSYQDVDPNQVPVTSISDAFAGADLASNPLVASGTGNTLLFSRSFTTTPTTYTFTFTSAQLQALASYIAAGNNLAFGLDSDCHFWNNGITFVITTGHPNAVPEPTTMVLLGTGLAGLYYRRRRQQQST